MSGVIDRAAARAAVQASDRLAAALRDAVPGIAVERVADGVAISGRGLAARMLTDPALRWPAGLLR